MFTFKFVSGFEKIFWIIVRPSWQMMICKNTIASTRIFFCRKIYLKVENCFGKNFAGGVCMLKENNLRIVEEIFSEAVYLEEEKKFEAAIKRYELYVKRIAEKLHMQPGKPQKEKIANCCFNFASELKESGNIEKAIRLFKKATEKIRKGEFELWDDVKDYKSLGYETAENLELPALELPAWAFTYFGFEKFGYDIAAEHQGTLTNYGWFFFK